MTGYHVERRVTDSGRWLRLNKEPIAGLKLDVTDLLDGNDYEVRVAAENLAGIGEFSVASPSFTAKNPWDKPGKPGRPIAIEIVGATVRLQWTVPESDGGAEIFNYIIELRVEGATKWTRYEEKELIGTVEHTLTKMLREDTFYEFRVAAENKAGVGPYSDISERVKTLIGQHQSLLKSVSVTALAIGSPFDHQGPRALLIGSDVRWLLLLWSVWQC